ncbi:uncharacterized protein LOC108096158 [Drosophila ficusphila]|uniref:uncharacterized protein LOC108096158 n=1 Tax=Drosophila ficusphila TaxID=30025 RepID=UPI001C8A14EF|nr:uncharacterized protein LOC108096158 [Drosophila ficusphila]
MEDFRLDLEKDSGDAIIGCFFAVIDSQPEGKNCSPKNGVLLILCFLFRSGLSQDCQKLKETCNPCIRRLNNPANNVGFINEGCRRKVRGRYIWKNQTRCDLQVIACGAHNRKMDCLVIAELAGMPRSS